MILSEAVIQDLNILADWLSVDDFSGRESSDHDLLILAGHAIIPNILGALYFASQANILVLLSGGIGHSTLLLKNTLQASPFIDIKDIEGESEAELLFLIATRLFHIPEDKIIIEDRSANCGQNADFSRNLLAERQFSIKSAILVQDPLMQRRTFETFSYSWKQKNRECQFINWPVFKPKLLMTGAGVKIIGGQLPGIWQIDRYISMILGEIKRLYDDESGYGPKGAGFISHVDIPEKVIRAWHRLLADPELVKIIR